MLIMLIVLNKKGCSVAIGTEPPPVPLLILQYSMKYRISTPVPVADYIIHTKQNIPNDRYCTCANAISMQFNTDYSLY
jgi:hypothetical protein